MRNWPRKSALIQPRASLGKSDESWPERPQELWQARNSRRARSFSASLSVAATDRCGRGVAEISLLRRLYFVAAIRLFRSVGLPRGPELLGSFRGLARLALRPLLGLLRLAARGILGWSGAIAKSMKDHHVTSVNQIA